MVHLCLGLSDWPDHSGRPGHRVSDPFRQSQQCAIRDRGWTGWQPLVHRDIGNKIGRITPSGQVTEFPVSLDPGDIKAGPDGNLWFTESEPMPPQPGQRNKIGRVTPTGQVTEFPLTGFLMSGEAFGPDGNLWFTEGVYEPFAGGPPGAAKRVEFLSRITPAGQITEIPLSGFAGGGEITFGPDGNLWYTYFDPDRSAIGRITPAGLAFEFSIPTADSRPVDIAAGPDGNLWFTESNAANIGRFRVSTTDLRVALSAPTVTGTAGQPLTYTISVTNDGPVEATDVVLTEELPTSTVPGPVVLGDPHSISASQGTVKQVAGVGFVAELGNLASGATATVTIVVTSATPQTHHEQAHRPRQRIRHEPGQRYGHRVDDHRQGRVVEPASRPEPALRFASSGRA